MKAKIRRQKPEARSAMPDGVRSGGMGKSGKRFSGYTPDELAGFKSRNVEIAESAIRGGKKFSEVAKEYNLTRERVRQIVKLMNPEAYLKRREDRRNRKKTMQYDRCAECGRGKSRWGSTPSRKYCHVDPEHLYCGACRKAKYQREIALVCRCGRKSKIMWGWLQYRKSRGEYKSARLSADGKTGTYVCLSCYRISQRRSQRWEITLICRCGRTSKMPGRKLLYFIGRGGYKSARLSADARTGTYVCPTCHKE